MLFFCHSEPSASKCATEITSTSLYQIIMCFTSLTASYVDIREDIASSEGAMCQLNNVLVAAQSMNSPTTVIGVLATFENLSER